MSSSVFVSCGQRTEEEKMCAQAIRERLINLGFKVCVAIETQSLKDVNWEILNRLKAADYYVFVDFKREKIIDKVHQEFQCSKEYRGSIFSHQELAWAHLLEFERALFFKQKGVMLEGLAQYMLSNATAFNEVCEVPGLIERAFCDRHWKSTYSRHLIPLEPKLNGPLPYQDRLMGSTLRSICCMPIRNQRLDLAAYDAVAVLSSIELPDGTLRDDKIDRSYLKWSGQSSYQRIIFPGEFSDFDAFGVVALGNRPGDFARPKGPFALYLHSFSDFSPRSAFILPDDPPGKYAFWYRVHAKDFPVLEFELEIDWKRDMDPGIRITSVNRGRTIPSLTRIPLAIDKRLANSRTSAGDTLPRYFPSPSDVAERPPIDMTCAPNSVISAAYELPQGPRPTGERLGGQRPIPNQRGSKRRKHGRRK